MKKILVFIGILFLSLSVFSQTIYICNSNVGAVAGTNVFTGAASIQNAHAAASNGDIIYVVPSAVNYSSLTVTKTLTIIGPGFNPDKTSSVTAFCNNFNIQANNCRVTGMLMGSIQTSGTATGTMFDKLKVPRIVVGTNTGSLIIQNCIIGENTSGQFSIAGDLSNTNIRISNNIIYGSSVSGYVSSVNGAIIEHNLFVSLAATPTHSAFNIANGCTIRNNIFFGLEPGGRTNPANFNNNDQRFNLSFGATDPTFVSGTNGNTSTSNIVGSNPLFTNFPTANSSVNPYSNSYDATLLGGSPAAGQGEAGVDMGILGGATPFDPFGTSIPIVQNVIAPSTVTQGTNMNVRVQAKGN